jgi:hypothetical protein
MSQARFRLRNPALLMALAAVFPVASWAAGAARIDFTAGSVNAVDAAGVQRPLSKGAEIGNGDTVRTGDGGRAQLRFSDGAMVSLQPQTDFRIDDYQYAGQTDGQEKGFFSLLKGGLRTITGWVGRTHRENYKVTTNVATIGIRGTEFSAILDALGNILNVATGEGVIEVCSAAGCMQFGSGESGRVQGGSAPQRTDGRPTMPPPPPPGNVQPVFTSGNQGLGSTPIPTLEPLTGTGTYSTVYAVTNSCCISAPLIDQQTGPGTINASGVLVDFKTAAGPTQPDFAQSTVAVGLGNDGLVAWGVWVSGSFNGFSGALTGGEGGDVLHYVVGQPTLADSPAQLGGASGAYSMIGPALVSTTGGDVGATTSATMNVDFVGQNVTSLAIGMSMSSGRSYSLSDSNMPISGFASSSGVVFSQNSPSVTGAGGACGGSGCSVIAVNGAFFGAGAPRAGVAFQFTDNLVDRISGAVALKK